jgi:hypothetical protein
VTESYHTAKQNSGNRDCHTRLVLTNGAVVDFLYAVGVDCHNTDVLSPATLVATYPFVATADVLVVNLKPAHISTEEYVQKLLTDRILSQIRCDWKLPPTTQLILQSTVPRAARCPHTHGKETCVWCVCPYEPVVVDRREEVHAAEAQACAQANAHLLDTTALYTNSIRWPNGTALPMNGYWYCDNQHPQIQMSLPDTEANALWTMLCMNNEANALGPSTTK